MYTSAPTFVVAALVGLSVLRVLWKRARLNRSNPLPPGPKQWPVVGNLFDMPSEDKASTFRKLSKKYGTWPLYWTTLLSARSPSSPGDIVYLKLLGKHMIVINSYDAAVALLEAKSANTSDRPPMVMASLYVYTL